MEEFNQCGATFEFYDTYDAKTGIASDPVDPTTITGLLTLNTLASEYSIPQSIPDGTNMNMANPLSLYWGGIVNQLQAITSSIVGANYISILFDRTRGSA